MIAMLARRAFMVGSAICLPVLASAQPRKKIVVGLVSWWPAFMEGDYVHRLRKGLSAYGYVEPETLELVVDFVGGDLSRARETTRRFVNRSVDVIVASATPVATIAKEETQSSGIPVVMAPVSDAVATGLVQSVARPGGNLTGMSMAGPDLTGKRLQVLRDLIPNLAAVAFVGSARDPNSKTFASNLERIAGQAGVKLTVRLVDSAAQVDDALMADFKAAGAQALIIQPIFMGRHIKMIEAATRAGLPSVGDYAAFPESGALFSYGVDDRARTERAAYFIDRIVKGTKPADLPIELPTEFALVMNRKAAASFKLAIPPGVIAQASEVIE